MRFSKRGSPSNPKKDASKQLSRGCMWTKNCPPEDNKVCKGSERKPNRFETPQAEQQSVRALAESHTELRKHFPKTLPNSSPFQRNSLRKAPKTIQNPCSICKYPYKKPFKSFQNGSRSGRARERVLGGSARLPFCRLWGTFGPPRAPNNSQHGAKMAPISHRKAQKKRAWTRQRKHIKDLHQKASKWNPKRSSWVPFWEQKASKEPTSRSCVGCSNSYIRTNVSQFSGIHKRSEKPGLGEHFFGTQDKPEKWSRKFKTPTKS